MKLLKGLTAFFVVIFLAYTFLPIPYSPGIAGMYNSYTHIYWCKSIYTCGHERGHALDQSLGWPSQSDKFTFAIQVFLVTNLGERDKDGLAISILKFPGVINPEPRPFYNTRGELYATLYANAWEKIDKIPEAFRKFYLADWNK